MEAASHQHQGPLSPLAATSQEPRRNAAASAAEVSPGDGAFSPPNDDDIQQDNNRADNSGDDHGELPVGFGPPPAFPSSSKSLRKRKRTVMSVSASANGAPLHDDSSDDEGDMSIGGKNKQSQMIHRIKEVGGDDPKSPENANEDEDGKKKYSDAMLLASLSDVDSPKKQEELVEDAAANSGTVQLGPERLVETRSPASSGTSCTAHTPLRSNVNPNTLPLGTVKPFALMPKPVPGYPNKRGKFVGANIHTPSRVAAPHSRDGRDPKAVTPKNEKGAREGVYHAPPHPQQHAALPGSSYPPGFHPGYPYPHHPHATPHQHPGAAQPAYPPGYPYHMSQYAPYPQGPPGSAMYNHSRAYYPQAIHAPPPATSSSSSNQALSPERWGQYHSPPNHQERNKPTPSRAPEPVRSNNEPVQPPFHPLSGASSNKSHVVPSGEDGNARAKGVYGRPPVPVYGAGPPPPGYPDSRYGAPPPPSRNGYYPGGPQPAEYNAISMDDGSPPRTSSSSHHGGHPGEYSPSVNTHPRGPYDYHHDQAQGPPGSHHGAYPPPHSQGGGYHPDSSPRSPYVHPPQYGGVPPPTAHDPYEPFDYAASSSPEAHYHVPTSVSNETEPSQLHPAQQPSPTSSSGGVNKYHQFRKGGRSIHSEPIILRKKFSWRNYPELEEYLIANRADYLRHSALNYTAEQKHFNNRLTEGLLELAAKLNYVFDETCFNFVSVRDRIRCYYKSYVQSSKKRGVVVGFSRTGAMKKENDGYLGEA